jgi:hypothetical protein
MLRMDQERRDHSMRELVIITILVLSVFSSKQLFIYNEEIIVALSFVGFVLFTQRVFGDTIKAAFDERQSHIFAELQQFMNSKEALLNELIKLHQLRSVTLRSSTQMIGEACIHHIITRCVPQCKSTVVALLSQQYEHKLQTLYVIQTISRLNFQTQIVSSFRNIVCNQFRFAKLRVHQPKLVRQSISLLNRAV